MTTLDTRTGKELIDQTMSVGQLARMAGISPNAVRLYERYGVVTGHRTTGNARRFTVDAACRIRLARAAQRVGLTLKESSEILAEIPPMCSDLATWLQAGQALVVAGQERIRDLESAVEDFRNIGYLQT